MSTSNICMSVCLAIILVCVVSVAEVERARRDRTEISSSSSDESALRGEMDKFKGKYVKQLSETVRVKAEVSYCCYGILWHTWFSVLQYVVHYDCFPCSEHQLDKGDGRAEENNG